MISDLVFLGAWGLIGPIFSIFILEDVAGATLITIGITSAIYWIVKSSVQIPVAMFIDKREGEKDDFYTLVFGLVLAGFSAILFLVVDTTLGLYTVQFIHAIAMGLYVPSWSAIFSRHIDKTHAAFNWSLSSTTIGFAHGVTALVGGVIGGVFGFQAIFILVGIFSFIGAFILFSVPHLILPKVASNNAEMFHNHSPVNIGK